MGNVWIAATLGERSVTKRYATKAEIVGLCTSISAPTAPFALRLSAQLMLGVARVFARKSDIVLSDSNALLQALQKHSLTTLGFDGKGAGARGFIQPSITLREADPNDAFNRITLPAQSKRKRSDGKAETAKKLLSAGTKGAVTSLAVALQGDPAAIDLPASLPWLDSQVCFDMEGAMEMAFPSLSVPGFDDASRALESDSDGTFTGSAEGTPSQRKGSGSKSTFRARPEDITLSQEQNRLTDSDLMLSSRASGDLMHYSMLQEQGHANASLTGSGNGGSLDFFMEPPLGQADEDILQDYNVFGLSKFAKSSRKATNDPDIVAEPNDLASSALRAPTFLAGGVQAASSFEKPWSGGNRSVDAGGAVFETGNNFENLPLLSPATPVQQKGGAEYAADGRSLQVVAVSGAKPPKLPRRGARILFDYNHTEFPTSHIRDNLNDPTSTLAAAETDQLPGRKRRRIGPSRAAIERALVSNPFMGSAVAVQLRDMWNDFVAKPELEAMEKRYKEQRAKDKHDDVGESRENKLPVTADEKLEQDGSNIPTFEAPSDNALQAVLPPPNFSDTPDAGATGAGQSDTPEFPLRDDTGRSAIGPTTQAKTGGSSDTAMEPERLRDRVFENVRCISQIFFQQQSRKLTLTELEIF